MQLLTGRVAASPWFPRLSLAMTQAASDIAEIQKLRQRCFLETLGLMPGTRAAGRDQDEYDALCEHLVVRDDYSGEVVGACRLLGPRGAGRRGRYQAERAFKLDALQDLRPLMAEAGRACVHPDYRGGAVTGLLWSGLVAWMARERCQYLAGVASISLADGGGNAAAVYYALAEGHLAPRELRVRPRVPFLLPEAAPERDAWIPGVVQAYLLGGAWIGGEPAWDPFFHCADLFMLLPLRRLLRRQLRRQLRDGLQ